MAEARNGSVVTHKNNETTKHSSKCAPGSRLIQNCLFQLLLEARLVFSLVAIISDSLVGDHITDQFQSIPMQQDTIFDVLIQTIFSFATKWDARHFLHIARLGYTFENNLAFSPLYPLLVRCFGHIWQLLTFGYLSLDSCTLLGGILITCIAWFTVGYLVFYSALVMFGHQRNAVDVAFLATVFYAINPATIFFGVCYTESLYCAFTFLGLYFLYKRANYTLLHQSGILEASICFGLALLTRSNGMLNIGYIGYILLCRALKPFALDVHSSRNSKNGSKKMIAAFSYGELCRNVCWGLLSTIVIIAPYMYHQRYIYRTFCLSAMHFPAKSKSSQLLTTLAFREGYVLPGDVEKLTWCRRLLPLSYAAVQAKYWQVKFLGYFELRKLPLFLLASPTLVLVCCACVDLISGLHIQQLGLRNALFGNPKCLLPFVLHTLLLAVFAVGFMNIEVVTRLVFSATPILYWYLGSKLSVIMKREEFQNQTFSGRFILWNSLQLLWRLTGHDIWLRLILCYSLTYAIVGTLLHVNFLPWT